MLQNYSNYSCLRPYKIHQSCFRKNVITCQDKKFYEDWNYSIKSYNCVIISKTWIIKSKVERVSVLNFKASLNLLGYNICKKKLFIYLKTIVIFTYRICYPKTNCIKSHVFLENFPNNNFSQNFFLQKW